MNIFMFASLLEMVSIAIVLNEQDGCSTLSYHRFNLRVKLLYLDP